MKTQSLSKTAPVKKTTAVSKNSSAPKSLVKTAVGTAHQAEKSVTNSGVHAEEIAARAYKIWQQQGCPEGREQQHWSQAEQEIIRDGSCVSSPLS